MNTFSKLTLSFTLALATHAALIPVANALAETRSQQARALYIEQIEAQLEQNEQLKHELASAAKGDSVNEKKQVRLQRWVKRLNKRLPAMYKKIDSEIAQMNDVQVSENLARTLEKHTEVELFAGSEREQLSLAAKNEAKGRIQTVAKAIVESGGLIPFILNAKKILQNEKDRITGKQGPTRSIASRDGCPLAYIIIIVCFALFFLCAGAGTLVLEIIGGVFGVGGMFMVIVGWALVCD